MPVANVKSKWIGGDLVFVGKNGNEIMRMNGTDERTIDPNVEYVKRVRFTAAQINAGAELLPALAGFKYQMVDVQAIAIGGNAGTVTTVDVLGTQTTSQKLAAFAQASLTRSTVLRPGIAGTTVLADGASFVANDANTAINVGKTGSALDTATAVDITIRYLITT